MSSHVTISYLFLGRLAIFLALFPIAARVGARPPPIHTCPMEARAQRLSVIDYYELLPSLGIEDHTTQQEKSLLLRPENHPCVDVRHDYLLVHPDSSPVEQIAVFRARREADLLAVSLPDSESDYNDFALYRLRDGRLRDVTRQMLPVAPRTDRFLYELPRFGTTISVYRFDLNTQSRRHVFDLKWRTGRFVKVR